jgi:bifunctional pyridoxal-dependent enzyme with beta-cystathionase and maltose regulon repressor activities
MHMPHDFDTHFARRDSDSVKWNLYGADVLPLWIAEADFKPPQAVTDALAARVAHGIFGYTAAIGHASAQELVGNYLQSVPLSSSVCDACMIGRLLQQIWSISLA